MEYLKNKWMEYILGLGFVLVLLLVIILPTDNLTLMDDDAYELNDNWVYTKENKELNFPAQVQVDKYEDYTVERVLDSRFNEEETLLIRSSMQYIKVNLDGQLIYESKEPTDSLFKLPHASLWQFVDIPDDSEGKKLSISYYSPYKAFAGTVNPINYGSRNSLIYNYVKNNIIGIISSILVLILGLINIVIHFFVKRSEDNRFLYLGIFSVGICIWTLSEVRILQFFIGNRLIIGGISYMMLGIFPAAALFLIRDVAITRNKKIFTSFGIFFIVSFYINIFLQLSGVLDFFISIRYVNFVLLLAIIFVLYELVYETFKRENKWAKRVLEYMSILLMMALFETIMFFYNDFSFISHFTSVGVLIFVALMGKDSIKHFEHLSKESYEKAYYEKLAYEDVLTKGKNRLCYNRNVDKYIKDKKCFRLTILDINNLKTINDLYGHDKGDEAIVSLHKILKNAFMDLGIVYRMSGDEFSVLSSAIDEDDYNTITSKVIKSIEEFNDKLEYPFSIAMGSSVFNGNSEKSFGEFYHEVDQLMYINKNEQKIKIV